MSSDRSTRACSRSAVWPELNAAHKCHAVDRDAGAWMCSCSGRQRRRRCSLSRMLGCLGPRLVKCIRQVAAELCHSVPWLSASFNPKQLIALGAAVQQLPGHLLETPSCPMACLASSAPVQCLPAASPVKAVTRPSQGLSCTCSNQPPELLSHPVPLAGAVTCTASCLHCQLWHQLCCTWLHPCHQSIQPHRSSTSSSNDYRT